VALRERVDRRIGEQENEKIVANGHEKIDTKYMMMRN